jgi:serine/threonine protein kinase
MFGDILPIPKQYSQNLKSLIDLLLKKDANLRPSINEILNIDYVLAKMYEFGYNDSNISPVNKQEAEINFNLLNVKFDNLYDKDENSSTSSRTIEKPKIKFESNLFKGVNSCTNSSTKNYIDSVRSNKYRKLDFINRTEVVEHEVLTEQDHTLMKNQLSVPELHKARPGFVECESPDKMSMEESNSFLS